MRLVLLGPPGAGKGTQAQHLTERLHIPKISTGEMLRDAAEQKTAVGLEAKKYTDQGRLVPDDIILELVKERLAHPDAQAGYLLDGFPRTVAQARAFRKWLEAHGQTLDAVVDIDVGDDEIVQRISNRRVCPHCGEIYHLVSRPPKVDEICDVCGHKLAQRDDDRPEPIRERLRVYHERTEPVLEYYRKYDLLTKIDGERPVPEVTQDILAALR
jgi:adenylate kinase